MKKNKPEISHGTSTAHITSLAEMGLEQFTPYLINRISSLWNADLQPILKKHGLSRSHMRTLAVLSVNDGITINELSAFTIVNQSTLSRTLDAMEKKGLVERRPRKDDARHTEVFVRPQGVQVFNEFWPYMYGHFQQIFSGIDESEFKQFTGTLGKVLNNLKRTPF